MPYAMFLPWIHRLYTGTGSRSGPPLSQPEHIQFIHSAMFVKTLVHICPISMLPVYHTYQSNPWQKWRSALTLSEWIAPFSERTVWENICHFLCKNNLWDWFFCISMDIFFGEVCIVGQGHRSRVKVKCWNRFFAAFYLAFRPGTKVEVKITRVKVKCPWSRLQVPGWRCDSKIASLWQGTISMFRDPDVYLYHWLAL